MGMGVNKEVDCTMRGCAFLFAVTMIPAIPNNLLGKTPSISYMPFYSSPQGRLSELNHQTATYNAC